MENINFYLIKKTIKKKDIEKNLNTSKHLSELEWRHIIYISSTNVYGSGYKKKEENEKIIPNKLKKNNENKDNVEDDEFEDIL